GRARPAATPGRHRSAGSAGDHPRRREALQRLLPPRQPRGDRGAAHAFPRPARTAHPARGVRVAAGAAQPVVTHPPPGPSRARGPVSNGTLQRWLAGAVILLVLLAVWLILRRLFLPIAWAAVLAFLMHPLQKTLTEKLGGRPTAAAGILTGLTPVAIFVPLSLLGLAFANQVTALTASMEDGGSGLFNISAWMDPMQHPRIASAIEWIAERFDLRLNDLRQEMREGT